VDADLFNVSVIGAAAAQHVDMAEATAEVSI
jgi:hypothetical protein